MHKWYEEYSHLPVIKFEHNNLHGKFDCTFSQPKFDDTVHAWIGWEIFSFAPQKFLSWQPPLEVQLHVFPTKLYDNIYIYVPWILTLLVPNYPIVFTGMGCDKVFCGAYWSSQGVNSSHCNLICNPDTFKSVSYSLIFVKSHYTFDHHTQCWAMFWMQIV